MAWIASSTARERSPSRGVNAWARVSGISIVKVMHYTMDDVRRDTAVALETARKVHLEREGAGIRPAG
jgi:hypothetical protein